MTQLRCQNFAAILFWARWQKIPTNRKYPTCCSFGRGSVHAVREGQGNRIRFLSPAWIAKTFETVGGTTRAEEMAEIPGNSFGSMTRAMQEN